MWTPNAASAPGHQVERPLGLDPDSSRYVQTHEHAVGDRLADRSRDLEEAFNHPEHQPTVHRAPTNDDKDDHDEKIKMMMTRIAELEASQPSSQGSGFMIPRNVYSIGLHMTGIILSLSG